MHTTQTLRRGALPVAMALGLTACGGGEDAAPPEATSSAQVELAPLELAERQARAALRPELAPDSEHYIVTLNAAVVAENERQVARTLGAGSAQTMAERAVQSVTARLLGTQGGARVRAHFTQALQGFAATVPQAEAADFVERLQSDPAVTRIEHDRVASLSQETGLAATTTPSLPVLIRSLESRLWGLDRIDQLKLPLNSRFQNALDGHGVRVYVVDTGVNAHTDFGSRLATTGYTAIQDGHGTTDCNGHGTHVAGTAAGTSSGVAPGATIVPVRVMPCSGGGLSTDIIRGLDWIATHGQRPGVVNISLGGGISTAMDEAVTRLAGAGYTVAVAAGNENVDACSRSPARAAAALTVAASTSTDTRAGFSNYGRCVDLFAPGLYISSAAMADPQGWVTMSGTSMASPHVAGAAALLLQERPKLTPPQVATQMLYQASASVIKDAKGSPNKLLFAGAGKQVAFPTPWVVHVAQMTGIGKAATRASWYASATVTVYNEEGQPQKDVKVTGQFSNRSNLVTCTTAASGTATGTCVLRSVNFPLSTGDVTFAVTTLTGTAMTYQSTANVRSNVLITRP